MATSTTEQPKYHKRDALRAIEKKIQAQWEEEKIFQADAPDGDYSNIEALHEKYPKFFGCMPYPYMNGRLHLGHAFSISKIEFAAGYQRLKGKRVLFPQAYHCTGMPIKACADKLKREIEMFGKDFSGLKDSEENPEEAITANLADLSVNNTSATATNPSDTTAKPKVKSKVAAKSGTETYQFQIMRQLGVPNDEIHLFADPAYWLGYFPPRTEQDLRHFGAKIDFRRSFITTDANPYYDSFVRWQMNFLKALNKIKYGERYTIYSPKDQQPCMDHDRQSGEGVGPQEYTGIKMEVTQWSSEAEQLLKGVHDLQGKKVFLVAATFRPETMYGQTNCFIGPEINYGLFLVNKDSVYACTERAARNMAYQGILLEKNSFTKIAEIKGSALVGTKVKAPLSIYKEVYVLPMENVYATKGTGFVTSVPSDSPDDYAATQDLAKKAAYYKIQPEWIVPFEPVPIIRTPNYGDLAAPTVCKKMKINSQKDRNQLAEAKDIVYKEGFYNGIMIIGDFSGQPVQEIKPKVREALVASGEAFIYSEPEGLVMSRSGDECVVALLDQWYLDYGEEKWRAQAEDCLEQMDTYGAETRNQFKSTLAWLNQWACARSFGLGSKLPWDPQFLVESLSDSTIYMAYYTIAHLLQGGVVDGSVVGPSGIKAKELTDETWNYIFGLGPYPEGKTTVSKSALEPLRKEYEYFYPLDIRASGKDLIPNHLTFFIYNHVAIFPRDKWPRAVRANGHVLLNRLKMSKSIGNFMTMHDAVEKFGADATRLALADAGDAIEDANFEEATSNAAILRLFTLKEWCEEVLLEKSQSFRTGEKNFHDRLFETEINNCIINTERAYSEMLYREALKYGFYEIQSARDWYRDVTNENMHIDLVRRFVEISALLVCPITSHWSEYIWREVLKKPETIMRASFPQPSEPVDQSLIEAAEYLRRTIKSIRDSEAAQQKKKAKGKQTESLDLTKPKAVKIFVATRFPEWQDAGVEVLKESYNESTQSFDDNKIKQILGERGLLKEKKMMPFVQDMRRRVEKSGPHIFNRALLFSETEILSNSEEFIKRTLGYTTIEIFLAENSTEEGDKKIAELAVPGVPTFDMWNLKN